MRTTIALAFSFVVFPNLVAAEAPPPLPDSTPPSAVDYSDPQALPESDVRIYRKERETIEEYSVSGRVYMLRVTPAVGAPYYLIDHDGDGTLESRTFSPAKPGMLIPQWILFSW